VADITAYRHKLDPLLVRHALAAETVRKEKIELQQAEQHRDTAEQAHQLIQTVAQEVQQSAHSQIAAVVSKCLATVFEQPYRFQIEFQRKRGQTEAKITFARGGLELDPRGGAGGGVIDVSAFALRLACLVLARPKRRLFLELDEAFRCLSAQYRPRIAEMFETLTADLGLQVLMVTHSSELEIGQVVRVAGRDGVP
jgi:DNA repair exonuclease SbcCD ATPase subunit